MKQILMLSDKIPTNNVGNVDSTMEKNAQHMVQDARNVSNTIIGSKCATVISRYKAGKPGHHPNRGLMAEKSMTEKQSKVHMVEEANSDFEELLFENIKIDSTGADVERMKLLLILK